MMCIRAAYPCASLFSTTLLYGTERAIVNNGSVLSLWQHRTMKTAAVFPYRKEKKPARGFLWSGVYLVNAMVGSAPKLKDPGTVTVKLIVEVPSEITSILVLESNDSYGIFREMLFFSI